MKGNLLLQKLLILISEKKSFKVILEKNTYKKYYLFKRWILLTCYYLKSLKSLNF